MAKAVVKKGLVFLHLRRIDTNGLPDRYMVTKKVDDLVYYRPINERGEYVGGSWKAREKYFLEEVMGLVLVNQHLIDVDDFETLSGLVSNGYVTLWTDAEKRCVGKYE